MEKLKHILSFLKNHIGGETVKLYFITCFALVTTKLFGFILGIILGLLICIGIDVYDTINFKKIFQFFGEKFFILLFAAGILLAGCVTTIPATSVDSCAISQMRQINKDTIESYYFHNMVTTKQIPPLSLFAKMYLRNEEERTINAYYVYYDTISCHLFNVKELVNNKKDTLYVVEKKYMK